MRNYRKYYAATAVSIAAAVGLYSVERNSNKDYEFEQLFIKNQQAIIYNEKYGSAIKKSLASVQRAKTELGLPGIVVGVSVNGSTVWAQGKIIEY